MTFDLIKDLTWFVAGVAVGSAGKNAVRLVWMQFIQPEQG